MTEIADLTTAILAGGLGTRLRSVIADRPKVLAEVHQRPFLEYLLDQLAAAKMREVVLCTGYLGDQIRDKIGERYRSRLHLKYSQEEQPLGTGGAVRQALGLCISDPILVMNGDSYVDVDLIGFLKWFCKEDVERILNVPEDMDIVAVIPVGYPAESPTRTRKPLSEVCELLR